MSKGAKSGHPLPVAHEVLLAASPEVELDGVSLELLQFALKLAYVHYLLFDLPLRVTAGKPARGCADPSHDEGRAFDVQTNDLTPSDCELFIAVTDYLANEHGIVRGPSPLGDDFASMHLERKPE